jgi:4-amino-4-deoxy-L-arabinose transferase-like glycosyltransferase
MPRARALISRPVVVVLVIAGLIAALLGLRAALATAPLDRLAATPAADRDANDPAGTRELRGSLFIARGGPVVIGFVSPGPARFGVGDRIITGAGLVTQRIILPAGPIAVRVAAPPHTRLVWSPVGRRGDPEYIPASSLAPEPPDRAQFGSTVGAAPLDGVIALLILLVVVASALLLARGRLAAVPRTTWLAMAGVFAAAVAVRWIDLAGHGETWDEAVYWASGRNYISNLLALDASPELWSWNFEHPPVMKYLAGIGAQFADGYGPARALSAVWVAIGCTLLVPIGARLFSLRTGVLAAVIAALLPPLVAHGQIVGHEAVTVLWWPLGILLSLTLRDGDPDRRTLRLRLVAIGVVIGLAIASRFTNGLLGPLCLVIVISTAPRDRRTWLEGGVGMAGVALLTLYVVWPRLWFHPLQNLAAAFEKLRKAHSLEPFLGAMTNHPGPHYFVTYLVATLPIAVLAGVLAFALRVRANPRSALILLAWFVIPLGVMISPVRQDGVRYVLPCVLALALASAAGWDAIATRLRSPHAFRAIAGALALYLAITLARVHPYYLDYFAEQVGGAGTVAGHQWFETAWWGEGVDRAVDYVNANAPIGARVFRDCIAPVHVAWFRADLWAALAREPEQADWVVTYAPQTTRCAVPKAFTRVFTVTANGAILAEVWRRP